jgi:hypothetical protein
MPCDCLRKEIAVDNRRIYILAALFVLGFAAVTARLAELQLLRADEFRPPRTPPARPRTTRPPTRTNLRHARRNPRGRRGRRRMAPPPGATGAREPALASGVESPAPGHGTPAAPRARGTGTRTRSRVRHPDADGEKPAGGGSRAEVGDVARGGGRTDRGVGDDGDARDARNDAGGKPPRTAPVLHRHRIPAVPGNRGGDGRPLSRRESLPRACPGVGNAAALPGGRVHGAHRGIHGEDVARGTMSRSGGDGAARSASPERESSRGAAACGWTSAAARRKCRTRRRFSV